MQAFRIVILSMIIFVATRTSTFAQKYLQIEKRGSLKVERLGIGSTIFYQLKDDVNKIWYAAEIQEMHVDQGILLLNTYSIEIKDIKAIRLASKSKWGKLIAFNLYSFGAGWLAFSLLGTLVDEPEPLNDLTWKVPLASGVIGTSALVLFKPKKYRMDKRYRIRLLDLDFQKFD